MAKTTRKAGAHRPGARDAGAGGKGQRRATATEAPGTTRSRFSRPIIARSKACSSSSRRAARTMRKAEIAEKICTALKTHTTIEEEIFYPAFLEATEDKEIHHEAEVEHDGAKNLIAADRKRRRDGRVLRREGHRAERDDQAPREGRGATRRHVREGASVRDGFGGRRRAASRAQAGAHERGRSRRDRITRREGEDARGRAVPAVHAVSLKPDLLGAPRRRGAEEATPQGRRVLQTLRRRAVSVRAMIQTACTMPGI